MPKYDMSGAAGGYQTRDDRICRFSLEEHPLNHYDRQVHPTYDHHTHGDPSNDYHPYNSTFDPLYPDLMGSVNINIPTTEVYPYPRTLDIPSPKAGLLPHTHLDPTRPWLYSPTSHLLRHHSTTPLVGCEDGASVSTWYLANQVDGPYHATEIIVERYVISEEWHYPARIDVRGMSRSAKAGKRSCKQQRR